ncbi:MAG: exodeoxyribonuclease VII large subunit [Burkholderiaceae bacterium]
MYPTPVQGREAPPLIVKALAAASARREVDLVLLVRGGGSLEDLWAFNDEQVARAIRASAVPVIVGVGHESDITIADFAADLRAPTPTAAAALAVPEIGLLRERVQGHGLRLVRAWQRLHDRQMQRLDLMLRLLPTPWRQWEARRDRLGRLRDRLHAAWQAADHAGQVRITLAARGLRAPDPRRQAMRVAHQADRLRRAMQRVLADRERAIGTVAGQLDLVSPNAVMARGYALLTDDAGRVLTGIGSINTGQAVHARLSDGIVHATVEGLEPDAEPGASAGTPIAGSGPGAG